MFIKNAKTYQTDLSKWPRRTAAPLFVFLGHQLIENSTDCRLNVLVDFLLVIILFDNNSENKTLECDHLYFICISLYIWNLFL